MRSELAITKYFVVLIKKSMNKIVVGFIYLVTSGALELPISNVDLLDVLVHIVPSCKSLDLNSNEKHMNWEYLRIFVQLTYIVSHDANGQTYNVECSLQVTSSINNTFFNKVKSPYQSTEGALFIFLLFLLHFVSFFKYFRAILLALSLFPTRHAIDNWNPVNAWRRKKAMCWHLKASVGTRMIIDQLAEYLKMVQWEYYTLYYVDCLVKTIIKNNNF